ncbi:MAG: hypothetical protein IJ617_04730 [Oscillospiraceae bacterium]|nr:hypothetical protein [Oscillospiraceae bacterium]
MKKIIAAALSLLCLLPLCGCIGKKTDPPDLLGQWKQINSSSETDYQGIYISDYGMECYWVLGSSNGAALYWAGSFSAPTEGSKDGVYTWTSEADTSRTTNSLLTDKKKTKDFKVENDRLTYTVDYEGVTMTVYAEKEDWGYDEMQTFGSVDMYDMVNGVYRNFINGEPVEPENPPAPAG